MSSHVKAIILRDLKDIECVKETLEQLNVTFIKKGNNLELSNSIMLQQKGENLRAVFNTRNVKANQFLQILSEQYKKNLQAKIERLRLEEAKVREAATLRQITEEELRKRELQLKREQRRLEAIRRQEDLSLKKLIDEKILKIKERAEEFGYHLQEQTTGKERVLVLVRRR